MFPKNRGRYICTFSVLFLLSAISSSYADESKAQLSLTCKLGPNSLGEDYYQMAVWLEDTAGNYVETLYVTDATGREGLGNNYISLLGLTLRAVPECLPVWAYARNVRYGKSVYPPKDKPLPEGMTGATIKKEDFVKVFEIFQELFDKFQDNKAVCRLELNVSRDGMPSMVFGATIDMTTSNSVSLSFIGYGDDKGRNGKISPASDSGGNPNDFLVQAQITPSPAGRNNSK